MLLDIEWNIEGLEKKLEARKIFLEHINFLFEPIFKKYYLEDNLSIEFLNPDGSAFQYDSVDIHLKNDTYSFLLNIENGETFEACYSLVSLKDGEEHDIIDQGECLYSLPETVKIVEDIIKKYFQSP